MVQQIHDQTTEQCTSCVQNHVPGSDARDRGKKRRVGHLQFFARKVSRWCQLSIEEYYANIVVKESCTSRKIVSYVKSIN